MTITNVVSDFVGSFVSDYRYNIPTLPNSEGKKRKEKDEIETERGIEAEKMRE